MTDTTRAGEAPRSPIPDTPLTDRELSDAVKSLAGWEYELDSTGIPTIPDTECLKKEVTFESRNEALDFVKRLHAVESAIDHDAEKTVCYLGIKLRLTTFHRDERITQRDVHLARCIDEILDA